MMTWKLWRVLNIPPAGDPIFRHAAHYYQSPGRWRRLLDYIAFIVVITLLVAYLRASFLALSTDLNPLILFVGLVLLGGTIYGFDWALAISDTVALARTNHTLDLLCITPRGAIGAIWSLGLSQLHRASSFRNRYAGRRRVFFSLGAVLLLLLFALGGMVLTATNAEARPLLDLTALLVGMLSSFAFLVATYLDFIQSIIVGVLVGMIVPSFSRQRSDAQLWAASGFLVAQFGSYLVTYLIGFVVLPVARNTFDIEFTTLELLLLFPRLIVFFLVREALIALLWRWLALHFHEETAIITT
jgi:uncharacterized membrane protein